MATVPTEIRFTIEPSRRFQAIDVGRRIDAEFGDLRRRYLKALYCSLHTTAGYLERSLSARLAHRREQLEQFFGAFRAVFPPNAPYRHDQIHLRQELTPEQKEVEPRNADSHLTFIGAGMRNCVTYQNEPGSPVFFIDLDGTSDGQTRRRSTSVLVYDNEQVVERSRVSISVSRHPIDAVNLADPRLGLVQAIENRLQRLGLGKGRVDIALAADERDAGLTVNEYETLLMKHDLVEVLRNPLRFAALKTRHILDDPLSVPFKTLNYARYDVVRALNSLIEAFRMDASILERMVAKLMAVPARRLLRSRKVSFLASDAETGGKPHLVRGTYQSPILVQWGVSPRTSRELDITLVRLG